MNQSMNQSINQSIYQSILYLLEQVYNYKIEWTILNRQPKGSILKDDFLTSFKLKHSLQRKSQSKQVINAPIKQHVRNSHGCGVWRTIFRSTFLNLLSTTWCNSFTTMKWNGLWETKLNGIPNCSWWVNILTLICRNKNCGCKVYCVYNLGWAKKKKKIKLKFLNPSLITRF